MGCLELPTARQLDDVPALHLFVNPCLAEGACAQIDDGLPRTRSVKGNVEEATEAADLADIRRGGGGESVYEPRIERGLLLRGSTVLCDGQDNVLSCMGGQEVAKAASRRQAANACSCRLCSLRPETGWPFKASEKLLVNRVLLSPIREDIKYPKGLPSKAFTGVSEERSSLILPSHLESGKVDRSRASSCTGGPRKWELFRCTQSQL